MAEKIPIIGLSSRIHVVSGHQSLASVNQDYVRAISESGGCPILLPISQPNVSSLVDLLDGLILTGGSDLTPSLYGQEDKVKLGPTSKKRDLFEFSLLEKCLEKNIPILGICRGCQLINVFFGGSLYQDLSYRKQSSLSHQQALDPDKTSHEVYLDPHSLLRNIIKEDQVWVNSFHHQGIDQLGHKLKIEATAQDGLIEAVYHPAYRYVRGVQWHPEMLFKKDRVSQLLFQDFLDFCKGKK